MPIAFVLLGQKLELPVTMSMAPDHLLVNTAMRKSAHGANVEATSGRNPDSGYEQSPLLVNRLRIYVLSWVRLLGSCPHEEFRRPAAGYLAFMAIPFGGGAGLPEGMRSLGIAEPL